MVLVWVFVILLWLIGLAGIILPALPGIGLVFAGILLYSVVDGFSHITPLTVAIFGLITLIIYGLSYLGALYGAKKAGGLRYTSVGTVSGAIAGLLLSGPFGLFIGAFLGAFLGSLAEGKNEIEASRVALFSVLGIIGSILVQFLLAIIMIISFLLIVLL